MQQATPKVFPDRGVALEEMGAKWGEPNCDNKRSMLDSRAWGIETPRGGWRDGGVGGGGGGGEVRAAAFQSKTDPLTGGGGLARSEVYSYCRVERGGGKSSRKKRRRRHYLIAQKPKGAHGSNLNR